MLYFINLNTHFVWRIDIRFDNRVCIIVDSCFSKTVPNSNFYFSFLQFTRRMQSCLKFILSCSVLNFVNGWRAYTNHFSDHGLNTFTVFVWEYNNKFSMLRLLPMNGKFIYWNRINNVQLAVNKSIHTSENRDRKIYIFKHDFASLFSKQIT